MYPRGVLEIPLTPPRALPAMAKPKRRVPHLQSPSTALCTPRVRSVHFAVRHLNTEKRDFTEREREYAVSNPVNELVLDPRYLDPIVPQHPF